MWHSFERTFRALLKLLCNEHTPDCHALTFVRNVCLRFHRSFPLEQHSIVAVPPSPQSVDRGSKRFTLETRIRELLQDMYAEGDFVGVQVRANHRCYVFTCGVFKSAF